MDWEKPRAHDVLMKPVSQFTSSGKVTTQQPVSIWRTYFIANEWNEIQTKRKINVVLHLVLVGFTLEVKLDPHSLNTFSVAFFFLDYVFEKLDYFRSRINDG